MKAMTFALAAWVAFVVPGDGVAPQDSKPAAAALADVASIDAIVKSLYDVISGPAGQARDWNRFRSLFIPKAQLVVAAPLKEGGTRAVVMTPDEFVQRSSPAMLEGFFEREIARRVDAYGDIAHLFSTYESRHRLEDEKPFDRGINSIQLMKDKDRWWVVSIFWCRETPARPIPAEYLPK